METDCFVARKMMRFPKFCHVVQSTYLKCMTANPSNDKKNCSKVLLGLLFLTWSRAENNIHKQQFVGMIKVKRRRIFCQTIRR